MNKMSIIILGVVQLWIMDGVRNTISDAISYFVYTTLSGDAICVLLLLISDSETM